MDRRGGGGDRGRGRGGGGGGNRGGGGDRGGGGYRGGGQGGGAGGYQGGGGQGGGSGGYRGGGQGGGSGGYQGGGGSGGYQGGGGYRGGGQGGGSGGYQGGGGQGGGGSGYQGGGGGRGGYGGDRGGGRGGGRSTGQKVVDASYNLPKPVTQKILREENSRMGWLNVDTDSNGNPILPKSRGSGKVNERTISLTTNNLGVKPLKLPPIIYHYDIDIDLSSEDKAGKKNRTTKGGGKSVRGGRQSSVSDDNGKDPPKPKLWRKIVKGLLIRLIVEDHGKRHVASDFMKSIYTSFALKEDVLEYSVCLSDVEDEGASQSRYNCTVSLVNTIETRGDLTTCVNGMKEWFLVRDQPIPADLINLDRVLNIAIKTALTQRFTAVGRFSFYPDPSDNRPAFDLGGGLVNWSGFSTIVSLGWKTFVNVDVANTAFLKGQKVYTALEDLKNSEYGFYGTPTDASTFQKQEISKAVKLLKGCLVEYETKNGGKLSGRVTDIINVPARDNEFVGSDNKKTNVENYFRDQYNIKLKYPKGLCLQVRGKSIVPAELCTIRKGQAFNAKLNEMQTANMIKVTAVPPQERRCQIEQNVKMINFSQDAVLKEFGMTVETSLHQVDAARVLPPPTLVYGSSRDNVKQKWLTPPRDGVWNMFQGNDISFLKPPPSSEETIKWSVINTSRCRQDEVYNFVTRMCEMGNGARLPLGNPKDVMERYKEVNWDFRYPDVLRKSMEELAAKGLRFVFVIVARKDKDLYSEIKVFSEIRMQQPILTQVTLAKNISKCDEATVGNLLLKINMKLGGVNYYMHCPYEKIDILHSPVLILGADVTHPGIDSKYPSLAAITGSLDRSGMPFQMVCHAQRKAEKGAAEVIQGLSNIVIEMLKNFILRTFHKPRKIIYYRDGVGDGQFGEVLNAEMMEIRLACEKLNENIHFNKHCRGDFQLGETELPGGYQPKITFIAVQKRHKVRFFVNNQQDGVGKGANAPPGTVVDTDIVKPTNIDFYLLSHTGIQGTSRPTRYQVIWDDSNFSIDELQLLTYYLCYMYARCNRSVSYPAPTYYAHLAATRAKTYAEGLSDRVLENIEDVNAAIERYLPFRKSFPMHFI